jgi:hypothetical protein
MLIVAGSADTFIVAVVLNFSAPASPLGELLGLSLQFTHQPKVDVYSFWLKSIPCLIYSLFGVHVYDF